MELANRLAQDWEEAPLLRGECAEISVEDARAVVEEVKPYMPEMAVTTIDEKLAKLNRRCKDSLGQNKGNHSVHCSHLVVASSAQTGSSNRDSS